MLRISGNGKKMSFGSFLRTLEPACCFLRTKGLFPINLRILSLTTIYNVRVENIKTDLEQRM